MTKQEASEQIHEKKILLNKFKLSVKKLKKEIKALAVIANGLEEEERKYSIGQHFTFGDSTNMLCAVGESKAAMMNLYTCCVWSKPVKVKDIRFITEKEFQKITGGFNSTPID